MIHFDLPKEKSSIIKVIGVGGGGSNAVNHMHALGIEGVNFIICNTDAQAIEQSKISNKIQLGPLLTQGLGAGANPEIGEKATQESLEEIKSILEVNTKMAFVTAGMGGGTGTGGAPIIAKICRDLNILTVGIVTTPFSHEGKKRLEQAQKGIARLRDEVDTLIVVSNDKLKQQYGSLKVREAFAKADNVLATAAKCITDVISTTGQINVDFADVCTVMRNGGVAILGSGTASGESRAAQAIQEALTSPLLNDNDIKGAKWILVNINSAEGEHEFTMDEVDTIQEYLISQAGEDADVILGLGYDNTLGNNISVTIIATGFNARDPFLKPEVAKVDNTIRYELKDITDDNLTEENIISAPSDKGSEVKEKIQASEIDLFSLTNGEDTIPESLMPRLHTDENINNKFENNTEEISKTIELTLDMNYEPEAPQIDVDVNSTFKKPTQLFADEKDESITENKVESFIGNKEICNEQVNVSSETTEEGSMDLKLIIKDENSVSNNLDTNLYEQYNETQKIKSSVTQSEREEFERRVNQRISALRNFNKGILDANNILNNEPAYLRKGVNLDNNLPDNYYSSYTVKKDDDESASISSINKFLDGEKPD